MESHLPQLFANPYTESQWKIQGAVSSVFHYMYHITVSTVFLLICHTFWTVLTRFTWVFHFFGWNGKELDLGYKTKGTRSMEKAMIVIQIVWYQYQYCWTFSIVSFLLILKCAFFFRLSPLVGCMCYEAKQLFYTFDHCCWQLHQSAILFI